MSEQFSWHETEAAQSAFLELSKEDRDFLIHYKYHLEANKMQVDRILNINHPVATLLHNWVNLNAENKKWYLKNINKIKLVSEGIELFWDVYDLEDIQPIKDIFQDGRWSREQAENYAKNIGKEIPDWSRLLSFFPENVWTTFFVYVMGMNRTYLWNSTQSIIASKNILSFGSVLSSNGKLRLVRIKN